MTLFLGLIFSLMLGAFHIQNVGGHIGRTAAGPPYHIAYNCGACCTSDAYPTGFTVVVDSIELCTGCKGTSDACAGAANGFTNYFSWITSNSPTFDGTYSLTVLAPCKWWYVFPVFSGSIAPAGEPFLGSATLADCSDGPTGVGTATILITRMNPTQYGVQIFMSGGGTEHALVFEQVITIACCATFTVANNITVCGCYTSIVDGFDYYVAVAKNGTITVTPIC